MRKNKLLLSFFLLSFPLLSHSLEMSCDMADDKKTSQLTNDINDIYPVNDADSCAVKDQLSKVATWRDAIPTKIQKFTVSNTSPAMKFPDLYEQIIQNSVNTPAELKAALKSAQEEYEQNNAAFEKIKANKNASTTQYNKAVNQVNASVKKWTAAEAAIKAAMAPTEKRVRDVLVKKLSSDAFKLKLKTLAANKHCIKNADFSISPLNGFYDNEKSEQDLAKQISSMENEKSEDSITVCSGIEKNRSATVAAVSKQNFDIGDEDFFGNNEHELSPEKVKRIVGKITDSLKSDKADCQKKVKSVQISTSANQLANSPEIGKWDFLKLSTARADFLAGIVKSNLKLDPKTVIETDPTGWNGDGTSGPCPYIAVKEKNGSYTVKLKDISKMKKALNDARYGSISLEIEEVGKGCTKAEEVNARPEHEYFASKCYSVGMECAQ